MLLRVLQLRSSLARSHCARRSLSYWSSKPTKAIVYSLNGDPTAVLYCASLLPLPSPPPPATVNIRYLLSPINPADINVVEGVYPSKPSMRPTSETGLREPVYIAGNEGLGQVVELGKTVKDLKEGDWVIMRKPQSGTWQSMQNLREEDVLQVNPPTAYGMLTTFVKLEPGEYVVQNGANSAIGQIIIQLASYLRLKTINFVRSRPEPSLRALKTHLTSLGGTHVFTYDDLSDKVLNLRARVSEWTAGKGIRLGLNCVGGKETSLMAGLLGQDAHLVSYGAMSKQPISLPTSLHIFNNLTSHGYSQSHWNATHSLQERQQMMRVLVELMEQGHLREPEHEVLSLTGSDSQIGSTIRDALRRLSAGGLGKKFLLRFEDELH